ncbi:CDP-glycerol glycerophosphotransferase family protein [Campylobacter coli]
MKICFFKIPILDIVKIPNSSNYNIYLFKIPFLSIRSKNNCINVNFLLLQRIWAKIKLKITGFRKSYANYKYKRSLKLKYYKGKIRILLVAVPRPSMWIFDYIYKALEKNGKFEIFIVIPPDPAYEYTMMCKYAKEVYDELSSKGYNPIMGYDFATKKNIDLRKAINPDIIFYSDFHKMHFHKDFYITNFLDKVTVLKDYGFSVMQEEKTVNFELNNTVDMYFRPTTIHMKMAAELMENKGRNTVLVNGSPKLDAIFDKNHIFKDVWKTQPKIKKRIIWAPHYSDGHPKDMYQYNAFYELYDFMFELALKFKDEIQIAFRPHPVLESRLVLKWGKEKQQAYYDKWEKLENGQYYPGDFLDLFISSDAMIMDSCSFMGEYTVVNKPLFHTVGSTTRIKLNDFGNEIYKFCYKTEHNLKQDIEKFIKEVVLEGKDVYKTLREDFIQRYYISKDGKNASESIVEKIVNYIEKGGL